MKKKLKKNYGTLLTTASNHCDGVPQVILQVFIIMLYENVNTGIKRY
jgi:hypothetical protein